MRRTSSYAPSIVLCLLLAAGCSTAPAPDARSVAGTDTLAAFLRTVDFETLRIAFDRLGDRAHTRYGRTEQFGRDGRRIAMKERIVRQEGPVAELFSDSSGAFDFGYLSGFVSPRRAGMTGTEVVEFMHRDEPDYLSPRNRDAYSYALTEDTLYAGRSVHVVEVRARPESGAVLAVLRARLYIERDSRRLLGLYNLRVDAALWYRELSASFVGIRREDSGTWLPDRARHDTFIRMPFRPSQRFRRVLSWYDYDDPTG